MAKHKAPAEDHGQAPPLRNAFVPCLLCGLAVWQWTWHGDEQRWEELLPVREPVSGRPHDCATAMVWYATRWALPTTSNHDLSRRMRYE